MSGKVIPFPVAGRTGSPPVPILARHHVVIAVGERRYEVDVGFVRPLQPANSDGGRSISYILTGSGTEREPAVVVQVLEWSQSEGQGWKAVLKLEGSKEAWEAYWRQLGIAGCSPGTGIEKSVKVPLALWPRQSDQSSCATSAEKEEVHMTNTESRETAPEQGATGANAAIKPARKATAAKGGAKGKRTSAQGGAARRSAGRRTRGKSAKAGGNAAAPKSRPESKGAHILELIGRANGATLPEIMRATSWQAHSVRGFLSTAAKKHGVKIASVRNEGGDRVYKLAR
jgi:Protein of unknown function (DUF3489)